VPRTPVPRPLTAAELASPWLIDRRILATIDVDSLWLAGHRALAVALVREVEFRHHDHTLTHDEVLAAAELRAKLYLF
jgi:hypothetical protein